MAKLTKSQVRHVAKLAGFDLSEEETGKFQKELSDTLAYIETLGEINTKGTEPTSQITGLENVTREDKTTAPLSAQEAIFNAPKKHNYLIKTKVLL
jgi:aspartyl-tRNA(Asn)/glutamyl-tRNA(Gln) amidotransferase subunit C